MAYPIYGAGAPYGGNQASDQKYTNPVVGAYKYLSQPGSVGIGAGGVSYNGNYVLPLPNVGGAVAGAGGLFSGVEDWFSSLSQGAKIILLGGLGIVTLSYVMKYRAR